MFWLFGLKRYLDIDDAIERDLDTNIDIDSLLNHPWNELYTGDTALVLVIKLVIKQIKVIIKLFITLTIKLVIKLIKLESSDYINPRVRISICFHCRRILLFSAQFSSLNDSTSEHAEWYSLSHVLPSVS